MAERKTVEEGRAGGRFRLRVSDALDVPLRGRMLRLRVMEGRPALADLEPGKRLRVVAPDGSSREVEIEAHAVTNGKVTQERLDRYRELDVILADEPADIEAIGIGWTAEGPVG